MRVGSVVEHCMGGRGVIVQFDGPLKAWVKFYDCTLLCFLSNLVEVL